jgi:hypothetical protein
MRRLLLVTALLTTVVVGWAGYRFFTGSEKSFPTLAPGLYYGSVRLSEGQRVLPWIIERREGDNEVTVVVGDPRYVAQRVPLTDVSGVNRSPLLVTGEESRLRCSGRNGDVDELEGACADVMTGEKGSWRLKRAAIVSPISAELRAELLSWSEIRRELDRTEEELASLRRKSDAQQASIDTFQRYVFADDALQQKATSRLGSTSSAIQELRAQADTLRGRLDESLRTLETAERLSPAGSLVLRSRESIERESRWIELTLRLLAPETSPGFEQSLERAQRVKALHEKIAAERRRVRDLENAEDLKDYQNEEEFYREMGQ